jgi:mono/diheme cytochrome c family protein
VKKAAALIPVLFLAGLVSDCDNDPRSVNTSAVPAGAMDDVKALTLLQANCFTCHNPETGTGRRIAPPMFRIREHYYDKDISKQAFVKNIVHFVNNPTLENSVMPGAVRNFGLMPKQSFRQEDLELMAAYMYDNDLASDEWYARWESFKLLKKPSQPELNDIDKGQNYAAATKAELGRNLLAAIAERSAAGAVEFCSTRAIPLTDSMARVFNASVRRVSDRPRNPANTATETELGIISEFKQQMSHGEKPAPRLIEKNGRAIGYYAIETGAMCLQCHGVPGKDILPETYAVIRQLYPTDKATGYAENQLRGLWVVTIDKKQNK